MGGVNIEYIWGDSLSFEGEISRVFAPLQGLLAFLPAVGQRASIGYIVSSVSAWGAGLTAVECQNISTYFFLDYILIFDLIFYLCVWHMCVCMCTPTFHTYM